LADNEVPPTPLDTTAHPPRTNSFPHQPTTSAAVQSFIDTSKPAINAVPIELDSTPLTSPTYASSGQKGGLLGQITSNLGAKAQEVIGVVKEKVGASEGSTRSERVGNNPAVLDKPLDEPTAEDFEAVKSEQDAGGLKA